MSSKILSHKGLELLQTGTLKYKVKKQKTSPQQFFQVSLMIILDPDSWFSKWLEMELMGLQLLVMNFSINNIFVSALSFMQMQWKIPRPFPVPQDAAPQPADVALLSNSEAGNGSCLCWVLPLPRSEISSCHRFLIWEFNTCSGSWFRNFHEVPWALEWI